MRIPKTKAKTLFFSLMISSLVLNFAFAEKKKEETLTENKTPPAQSQKQTAKGNKIQCNMDFNLKTWSVIYKSGKGTGTIHCNDGSNIPVMIRAHGGGFTFGKSKLEGKAHFTGVDNTKELLGSYASATAHGGIVKSGNVQGMTKGPVSMSLTSSGNGFDLGIAFGSFKISRR